MSIKSLLMPMISRRLLSQRRQDRLRAKFERQRRASGSRHEVFYFHQVDDPYSALASACLPLLAARYDIDIVPHVVGAPPDAAAPERAKLIAYSRKDAALLAQRFSHLRHENNPLLRFADPNAQPSEAALAQTRAELVAAVADGRFTDLAWPLSARLWLEVGSSKGSETGPTDASTVNGGRGAQADAVAAHIEASNALRQRLGHYLGAMFFYGGEWYWGIDRLHHLERRLQALGAARAGVSDLLFAPPQDPTQAFTPPPGAAQAPAIEFFVSLRSPYSAIVAPRVFELGRLSGAAVNIRYVLPMVMRGLPVPREKRSYISLDTAREARFRGIPFGCVNDPVGRPTERGIALLALAMRLGKGQEYLLSFMRGVWAEGIDAGSDRGLRKIAERAGLDWAAAREALQDEAWRATAEANRAEMFGLGLWGVPSFRCGDTAVWGQDRLWAVADALMRPSKGTTT